MTSQAGVPERVRAVVFDLDGVLVDSLTVARTAFAVAYAEVVGDGEPPVEEYCRHPGRHLPDVLRLMGLPASMAEPFVRESHRLTHLVEVVPGMVEVLDVLRGRGVPLAVATGRSGVRARALLGHLGLMSRFEAVLGADEVPRPKPAPDIVLRALALLDVPPAAAVMVGDAVSDIRSARGAGVTAVAVGWGETDRRTLVAARPDLVVDEPADLLRVCAGPTWADADRAARS
ncbi:HAD-IA family hydrolase [Micromonospora cathayae]|uniref:HAD-IA family hydrolase n=1 Tax=Micromonospora cathayae TaxID=3028804 RepID=A0ABY7ZU31_9ACTN|nr:HAD-IA family hydrolase [Micromonospora sp. HUAS 3]WDZ86557.1 HAD-IA family hydrolase [Micromonospora sp. HUAS 3]